MGKKNNLVNVNLLARLKFLTSILYDILLCYTILLSKYVYRHIKERRPKFGRPGCVMEFVATCVSNMRVRVCVCVCVYVCMYISMYVCMYVRVYVRMYFFLFIACSITGSITTFLIINFTLL
jgi:hypothetical protein